MRQCKCGGVIRQHPLTGNREAWTCGACGRYEAIEGSVSNGGFNQLTFKKADGETVTQLLERMRGLEADHGPDGWPAIQMRDVSALCNEIDALQTDNEIVCTIHKRVVLSEYPINDLIRVKEKQGPH